MYSVHVDTTVHLMYSVQKIKKIYKRHSTTENIRNITKVHTTCACTWLEPDWAEPHCLQVVKLVFSTPV